MKKVLGLITLFALLLAAIQGCKEIGPDINLHGSQHTIADTTYVETPVAAETKNVLIEDFTGMQCPNCPTGHDIIVTLKTQNPGRIVAIAQHPTNILGRPYQFNPIDLENGQSDVIFNYLGQTGFEPAGAIDRQLFTGESFILLDKNYWSTRASQQLGTSTPVNILLSKSFDSTNRQLTITTELHYTQSVSQKNYLSLALIENGIVAPQLNGNVIDTLYVHDDVMRTFVTDPKGDALTDSLQAGRVIRKIYRTVLDAGWKANNVDIIGFVHEKDNSKAVYQSKEIKVID